MQFAKLEMYMMLATFLATYDFKLCDKNGAELTEVPEVDLNKHSAHKPKQKVYIKYERRV